MAKTTAPSNRRGQRPGRTWLPPTVTLAFWQVRQTWGLLLITGVGILVTVVFVCAAPLYSEVATTAGLRNILTSNPQNSAIAVTSTAQSINQPAIKKVTDDLNQEVQNNLGNYLASSQFSIEVLRLPILTTSTQTSGGSVTYKDTTVQLRLLGKPMDQAVHHLTFVQGRAPQTSSQHLEVALSRQNALGLHATLGDVINIRLTLNNDAENANAALVVPLHVVGIFEAPAVNDLFWQEDNTQANNFTSTPQGAEAAIASYTALTDDENLLNSLYRITSAPAYSNLNYVPAIYLHWNYHLDGTHISSSDLDTILGRLAIVQVDNARNIDLNQPLFDVLNTPPTTTVPGEVLQDYQDQLSVAQIPTTSITLLISGLMLYFLIVMAGFLIERQAGTIAILRSRGAGRLQIFGSLTIQSSLVGLIAACVGPFLAFPVVRLVVGRVLPYGDLGALDFVLRDPWQTVFDLSGLILGTVVVAVVAMLVAISQTTFRDVLAMRREAARATHRPLWQRLYLDVAVIIIALVGYIVSLYVTNGSILDVHLRLVLFTPLVLLRTIFLLIAGLLLFLRFFPTLLRIGSWLTMRRSDATSMIAMTQIARSPRYAIHFTLLLALTTTFALFSLIFAASQSQRTFDVAAFQSLADFSGTLPTPIDVGQLAKATTSYRQLSGVQSATLGFTTTRMRDPVGQSVSLLAVDSSSFARTAIWTDTSSQVPLTTLFSQLATAWQTDTSHDAVPAMVDADAWDSLHLSTGTPFTLADSFYLGVTIKYIPVVRVEHIPSISSGGILVDYQHFSSVYTQQAQNSLAYDREAVAINHAWLRTSDDPAALASLRTALSSGGLQLDELSDRRTLVNTLQREPLYANIIGILAMGVIITLLLAVGGSLLASWLNARSRVTFFAVLRALGAAPRQVASTLSWEQGIIYTTAILLGIGFGALLSSLAVPLLVFSGTVKENMMSQEFYATQNVPPIQIIIPALLGLVFAIIVAICFVVLGMMIRVVSRPSPGQALRLNED